MTMAEKKNKAAEGAETAECPEPKGNGGQEWSQQSMEQTQHLHEGQNSQGKERAWKEMQKQKGPGGGNVHGEAELTPLLQYQRECVPEHIPSQKEKMEKRKSELKMMEEFGEDEFYAHLQNGRIEWRKNPWTPGVYNYRDIGQRKHSEDH